METNETAEIAALIRHRIEQLDAERKPLAEALSHLTANGSAAPSGGRIPPMRERIADALREHPGLTHRELATALEMEPGRLYDPVRHMIIAGDLRREGKPKSGKAGLFVA